MRGLLLLIVGCARQDVGPWDSGGVDTDRNHDTGAGPDVEWAELNYFPCGRTLAGEVVCWSSAEREGLDGYVLVDGPAYERRFTAIDDYHHWGVVADDGSSQYFANIEDASFWDLPSRPWLRDLLTYCALDADQIVCAEIGSSPFPADRSYVLLAGHPMRPAAVDSQNRIIVQNWCQEGAIAECQALYGPALEIELPPTMQVVDVIAPDGGVCVLDSGGVVTCFGAREGLFPNAPYTHIAGDHFGVCAAREDGVIECSDGTTHTWGPLRDLLALGSAPFIGSDEAGWDRVQPVWGGPVDLCAITEDNAIRCAGWRYDFADLQAQLPQGD